MRIEATPNYLIITVRITINVPEGLVESAQYLGAATARNLSEVLVDTLEIILPTFNNLSEITDSEISQLANEDVIELANLKMEAGQNQRLGELQAKGKTMGLTESERYELLILLSIYQVGQFRKSAGLAEAVRRGLRTPLSP
ncbi:hypothetical protein [Coleofasciculus sp. F4-SAH-05]|uniref:hypothetical protein n=1 Tax=Coleofasciculus sp. F4-SAH-05 TaxID=3069525 RepID=UPI004063D692